jgi:sigma-E factor negative regulatory protein RseC
MEHGVATVRGIVRDVDGGEAFVEVEQGGCGRCHEEGGCGGQPLTRMFCSGPSVYRVDNAVGAGIGDRVDIAVKPGNLRLIANRVYLVPLAAGIGGGALGMAVGGEPLSIAGFLLGLAAAFLALRRQGGAGNPPSRPYIISRKS